jgi:hypothetical protein
MRPTSTLIVVLALAGCAPGVSDRAAAIHEALARDNRDLALRDAREVEARLARMAQDPFSFFRGSVGLWARDVTTPGAPGALPSGFIDGIAAGVLLVGDPHPENLGTHRLADGLLLTWNDFDVARFGPAVFDLRRLALGFAVGRPEGDTEALIDAVVEGYVDGLRAPRPAPHDADEGFGDDDDHGRIARDLFQRARRRGAERSELEALTADGRLALAEAAPPDLETEVLLPVGPGDAERLRRALIQVGLPVNDIARAIGRGVGSRPLLRFVAALDDGRLVQIKEARDPFILRGYAAEHERFFGDNGDRVVSARRALIGHDGADVALRALDLSPAAAFTTTESGFVQTARLARLDEGLERGDILADDIVDFAHLAGRLLATAHRDGLTVDGAIVGDTLRVALGLDDDARVGALRDETRAATFDALAVARDDHERLAHLLEVHGPLLGRPRDYQAVGP